MIFWTPGGGAKGSNGLPLSVNLMFFFSFSSLFFCFCHTGSLLSFSALHGNSRRFLMHMLCIQDLD